MTSKRISFVVATIAATAVFQICELQAVDYSTSNIKYATVCSNTQQLEQIGAELRSAFSHDFRQSGVYRKLAWNAGKLKRQSARLHRTAHRKSDCRWEVQIERLEKIVCTLEKLVADAHNRIASRLDPPCYSSALDVDRMIEQAKQLVLGLNIATGTGRIVVERPTVIEVPVQSFETAPDYNPNPPLVLPENTILEAPIQTPSAPVLIPDVPNGATIIPDIAPRSVLEPVLEPFGNAPLRLEQNVPASSLPVYEDPPLGGLPPASFDTAKSLKKLKSK